MLTFEHEVALPAFELSQGSERRVVHREVHPFVARESRGHLGEDRAVEAIVLLSSQLTEPDAGVV